MHSVAPLLVTGGTGQVGSALARLAASRGITIQVPDRQQLDLRDPESIATAVSASAWSAVINCAAYTAVDKAESEPALAASINAAAPGALAGACAKAAIPLIHLSTDYVFDGDGAGAYVEDDPVRPINVYGLTKEAGESAIRSSGAQYAIIRTAWVVSSGQRNFLDTMLRLGAERSELRVVCDQHGNPTGADDIAEALLAIAAGLDGRSGTWHFVNRGHTSWFGLARHIFAETSRRDMPTPVLVPIPASDYPTPAARPRNSRLSTRAIERDFGLNPRPWQDAVDAILEQRLLHPGPISS